MNWSNLRAVTTEMIVGVLAHEIGHVELEHSLRQIYRVAGMAGLIMLIAGDVGEASRICSSRAVAWWRCPIRARRKRRPTAIRSN